MRAKLLYEGKKLPTKDEQVWGYVFKLSIKASVRKMMETKLKIGKSKACGFKRKARKARLSTMCMWGKQTSKKRAREEMCNFILLHLWGMAMALEKLMNL